MTWRTTIAIVGLLGIACPHEAPKVDVPDARATPPSENACSGALAGVPGKRKVALLVGVGKHRSPDIAELTGPANDVQAMSELLVKQFGFPKENLCVLLDGAATLAGFRSAFEHSLIGRVSAGDQVVIYYSGHGSQTDDLNGDEDDQLDETWVLYDSRVGGVSDLIDDEVEELLSKLTAKTPAITLALDSCNSASAYRDPGGPTTRARWVPPASSRGSTVTDKAVVNTRAFPELVVLSGAADGTSALERDGHGIFTDAIVTVLGQPGPLVWSQVEKQVRPVVAARSPQKPAFQGNLERLVFGASARRRPLSWEVIAVGTQLELKGPPLPGMGEDAELRLFDATLEGRDFTDPAKSKATIIIKGKPGLTAVADLPQNPRAPIVKGDVAVLVRASRDTVKLGVRIRPASASGGVPASLEKAVLKELSDNPAASSIIEIKKSEQPYELSVGSDGGVIVWGPEGTIRKRLDGNAKAVVQVLGGLARNQALKLIQGEGGAELEDQKTLSVTVTPSANQPSLCGQQRVKWWQQSQPNVEQVVPLCVEYDVNVELSPVVSHAMLVGGVFLFTDGSALGFPEQQQRVQPGGIARFKNVALATPPLSVQDTLRVFATAENNPVQWRLLTYDVDADAGTRDAKGPLSRALGAYVANTRGGAAGSGTTGDDSAWVVTTLPLRTEANPTFADQTQTKPANPMGSREYVVPKFDISPYLPESNASALYKVLSCADDLAKSDLQYKQHQNWKPGKDKEALKDGIDCSRAVWFAFTRAGLGYSKNDAYLSTAQMVETTSPLAEHFDRCDGQPPYRLGDLLVYRDDAEGDGHVVMVIDPALRIAWGSHGWDGNVKDGHKPERGVEYQLIKYKNDWARWDRPNMLLKACWRHRTLAAEVTSQVGLSAGRVAGAETCGKTGGSKVCYPLPATTTSCVPH
jgi:Caspase domain